MRWRWGKRCTRRAKLATAIWTAGGGSFYGAAKSSSPSPTLSRTYHPVYHLSSFAASLPLRSVVVAHHLPNPFQLSVRSPNPDADHLELCLPAPPFPIPAPPTPPVEHRIKQLALSPSLSCPSLPPRLLPPALLRKNDGCLKRPRVTGPL